ncbi:MAG TPA: hypothetical protein VK817_18775 [Trebonia sp.]|jgi:hypothetical protein|nr:hypothetical protein [Trebonia sp.]
MYSENQILLACMDLIDEAARALGQDVASLLRRNLAVYADEGWHRGIDPAIVTATVLEASSPPTLADYAKYINFDAGQRALGRALREMNDETA